MRTGHGKAVDWWSLGALMYDMLTGSVSFLVGFFWGFFCAHFQILQLFTGIVSERLLSASPNTMFAILKEKGRTRKGRIAKIFSLLIPGFAKAGGRPLKNCSHG